MDERAADDKNYFYDLIGVSKTASVDEIRKAYRKIALENHPDKGCDPEKFLELRYAYSVLSKAEYRKLYDEYGEDGLHMISDSAASHQKAINIWQRLTKANCPDDEQQVVEEATIICDQNQPAPPLPSPPPSPAIKRPKLPQDSSTPLAFALFGNKFFEGEGREEKLVEINEGKRKGKMDERAADDKNYYYDLIGVSKTASEDEIRKAYRKIALQNHPDKGCDLEKFLEIRHAYEVLSVEEYRKLYDEYGEDGVDMINDSNAHHQEAINTWQRLIQANCPDDEQVLEEETIIICDQNQPTPPLPSPSPAIKTPKLPQDS